MKTFSKKELQTCREVLNAILNPANELYTENPVSVSYSGLSLEIYDGSRCAKSMLFSEVNDFIERCDKKMIHP